MPTEPARPARRRGFLLALAAPWCSLAQAAPGEAPVELWLDLSEPVPAAARRNPADADAKRRADVQRQRVQWQQQAVGEALRELGVTELARVSRVRNAIAVRARRDQVPMLRRIPGVVRLRPATTLHPPQPQSSAPTS